MKISSFINENIIWLVPVISIILTMLIKVLSIRTDISLTLPDIFGFGLDLCVTTLILILSNSKNNLDMVVFVVFFIIILFTTVFVNRKGWKQKGETGGYVPTIFFGVILPDVIGIVLLVIATLYLRGFFG